MRTGFDELNGRWLALRVRSTWEMKTAAGLRERGYEEFVPLYRQKRKWSDRTKMVDVPLFTGYIFVRFDAQNSQPIITTPGVIGFVGIDHIPIPIEDREVDALRIITEGTSNYGPCDFLRMGPQEIEIKHGPLAGLKGKIVRFKNQERLVVSVELLQKSVFVELDGFDISMPNAYAQLAMQGYAHALPG